MYEALRVGKHKMLVEFTFTDLGKINVICGKNNSGKSTLLEAIAGHGELINGLSASSIDVSEIYERTLQYTGWMVEGDSSSAKYSARYREQLSAALTSRNIWFFDEAAEYAADVLRRTTSWCQSKDIPVANLEDIFRQMLQGNQSAIVVPPKRLIEVKAPASFPGRLVGAKVVRPVPEPGGKNLLTYLFYCKNSDQSAAEASLYADMLAAFAEISRGYHFDVVMLPDSPAEVELRFAADRSASVKADDSGSGLRDLLAIVYFALEPSSDLVLIEEPESHMHPEMQKKLLSFLQTTGKQYFLTTHSNVFLDGAFVDRVFFTKFENNEVAVDDATSKAAILGDLGYSVTDNLVSDLVILTEGPSDIPVIEEFLVKMDLYGRFNVKMWPLGGDNMDQADLSVLRQNTDLVALIDGDPGSEKVRNSFVKQCQEAGVEVTKLSRYAIENYFTLDALRAVFPAQVPEELESIDPHEKLEKQINWNVKKNNREIARRMSLEDIKGTDLYEFLEKVKGILEA